MTRSVLASALASAVLASAALSQCPSQGVTLSMTGHRLGDPAVLQIAELHFAPGLLGIDTASGPTMTSIGPICLGLTSALHITPFTFDATGHFQIAGTLPADPGFSGLALFMQAVAASRDRGQSGACLEQWVGVHARVSEARHHRSRQQRVAVDAVLVLRLRRPD